MKSILLIGVGSFGKLIAKQIHELGHQVMAIDKDEDRINEVLPYVTNALIGDSTNESFLNSIGSKQSGTGEVPSKKRCRRSCKSRKRNCEMDRHQIYIGSYFGLCQA